MEKDNARKALGLPIMSELTNEELNKELEIAVDNTLNGCTFIPRFDPAHTRRISLEKTRDEQYQDIHNEFRLGRIDSISHFTCDGDTIKKDGPTEINISYVEWENIADPVYLDGDTLKNSMGNEVELKEDSELYKITPLPISYSEQHFNGVAKVLESVINADIDKHNASKTDKGSSANSDVFKLFPDIDKAIALLSNIAMPIKTGDVKPTFNISEQAYQEMIKISDQAYQEMIKSFAEKEADNTVQVVLTDRQIRDRLTPECIEKLKLWPIDYEFQPGFMPPTLPPDTFSNLKSCIRDLSYMGNSILHLKSKFRMKKIKYKKDRYLHVNFGLSIPTLLLTMAACMDAKNKEDEDKIINKIVSEMLPINLKAINKLSYFMGKENVYSGNLVQLGHNTLVLPLLALLPNPEIIKQDLNIEDCTMSTIFKNSSEDLIKTYNMLFAKMSLEDEFWIQNDDFYKFMNFSRGYKYFRYKTKRK